MPRHRGRDRGPDDPRLTPADEGKRVVTATGEAVGTVARVDESAALVRPRKGLLDGCGSWLSSPWCDSGPFELDAAAVVRVTDDAVVLLPHASHRKSELSREADGPLPER